MAQLDLTNSWRSTHPKVISSVFLKGCIQQTSSNQLIQFRTSHTQNPSFSSPIRKRYHTEMICRVSVLALLLILSQAYTLVQPNPKVTLELFYETQCPYCTQFITNQLQSLIAVPDIFSITDFVLYPFGNAKIGSDSLGPTFSCQHGDSECDGNMVANCALRMYPQTQGVPFAVCLQQHTNGDWWNIGPKCAKQAGINWDFVEQCVDSGSAKQSMYQVGVATNARQLGGVPALFFQGADEEQLSDDFRDNLLEYICNAYKGPYKIGACGGI